ncbi:DNA-directed RNA polymerase, mitochondrial isoform X16 [Capricornis sumatraensis]|uniref:DNA-directed RNA polymerase, mitochondrial isoform X16 n=1 Tax=Capricornis sumatraensis TaxID=34865 RepID=UPI0036044987
MSALRCGRGAAGLRRALWPKGHPCLLAEEGTLGGVWGRKRSLSASACEQDRRKGCGHAELLEVLEARVRQLQAEGTAEEVTVKRVAVAQAPEAGGIWPPRQAPLGAEGALPMLSSRWAQKLDKDQQLIEKRWQQLDGKLPKMVEKPAWEKRLRMEPRLLSRKLAGQLQQWERKRPQSPWEEQLARLLQEAPQRLSREADEGSESRLEGQRQKLLAFLECCLLTGHLPLAHHVLVAQHSRAPQQQLLTLAMYNTVMLGWARQGSFKELMYVFFMLKDAGLAPDLLSYAAALQCMGRLDQDAGTIQRCLKQMEQDRLSLQGLFSAVLLSAEEREELLRAVRKARPAFRPQPPPPPPPQVNTSPLLQEIYAKDPSVSYPKLHLSLKELQGLFRQQLGVEMATTVTVESVEKAPLLTEEVLQARKTLAALRAEWESVLSLELQEMKESEARAAAEGRPSLFPYLCLLSEKELVGLLLQTLQALPPHGESLLFLAHELGVRVLKRKRLRNQVEELEQRYSEYLHLLASDTQIGILKPHPAFTQLQETAAERTLIFESTEVPMLCPPLPWTSPHSGAFLLSPTKMMRSLEGTQQHQLLLERCPPAELHGALDALTQLGNCAWRVNGRVLDLVLDLFRDKGCPRLGVPAPPTEAPRPPEGRQAPKGCLLPEASPADKAEMRRELARRLKVAREMQSLRADALYRLSLAQHLRNHVFWLPHNMDFRGRTYPCSPHFNHLGSDLARALLEFAQGRPLGPHGLDWLKIHLVNLTGLKKRESLQTRRDYADAVMEDILDSAERPMTGRKWWMEADEPWQTLACCMEIARVVHSPDPTTYISHFPVHQDGSCNGLQHYAALGRDSTGAASVNLSPSDLPQDVYSEVAAQVEVFRKQDANRGVRVAQVLEGFISRKVVKQTVMTVVYGVTRYGGRLQIERRLRELEDFPQEFVWEASHYLVRQVFNSLQEMFSGTRSIQRWLTESARLISLTGSAVEWITPLGVPIIQPYHRDSKVMVRAIKGGLQSLTFSSTVDTNQKGLTFVSVHDCFWTHAADVGVMNQVCREQFVRLHSQPILHDLSRFLLKRFCPDSRTSKSMWVSRLKDTLLSVPPTGTFDLEQVKRSTFFFS